MRVLLWTEGKLGPVSSELPIADSSNEFYFSHRLIHNNGKTMSEMDKCFLHQCWHTDTHFPSKQPHYLKGCLSHLILEGFSWSLMSPLFGQRKRKHEPISPYNLAVEERRGWALNRAHLQHSFCNFFFQLGFVRQALDPPSSTSGSEWPSFSSSALLLEITLWMADFFH